MSSLDWSGYGYRKCTLCGQSFPANQEHDCPVQAKLDIEELAKRAEAEDFNWHLELGLDNPS